MFNVFCPFEYERFKCNESYKLRLAVLIDFMTEDCSMEIISPKIISSMSMKLLISHRGYISLSFGAVDV